MTNTLAYCNKAPANAFPSILILLELDSWHSETVIALVWKCWEIQNTLAYLRKTAG